MTSVIPRNKVLESKVSFLNEGLIKRKKKGRQKVAGEKMVLLHSKLIKTSRKKGGSLATRTRGFLKRGGEKESVG